MKIKKNHHYPFPYFFITLPIWVSCKKSKIIERNYFFTKSCLYDLHNVDELDTNKLFGFSIGYHHNTSFRFGWRPILEENKIELIAYEYQNKIRSIKPICKVNVDQRINFKLGYNPITNEIIYCANDSIIINKINLKKKFGLGYKLGLYFGGNETAPQDIYIFRS